MKSVDECLLFALNHKKVLTSLITKLSLAHKSTPALLTSAEHYHAIIHYLREHAKTNQKSSGD